MTGVEIIDYMVDVVNDMSAAAAARELSVHPETVKRWALRGQLAYWKTPGGQFRFKRSDIEKLHTAQLHDAVKAAS